MKTPLLIIFLGLLSQLQQSLGANILMVFPHIYYSHFKETSRLVTELGAQGHNITFVTPYSLEEWYDDDNIKEISIEGIIEPIEELTDGFYKNENHWGCYWSKLQYVNKIGFEYTKQVLENENVTELILSNSRFDLVIIEDVSGDGLAVLSHVFECPLVVLLSEPLSIFYDNYLSDNSIWNQKNDLKNAHNWVLKELYREWYIIPNQNKLISNIIPSAPDLRHILYDTNLILMPSYSTLSDLMPKYPNVKQIGGFHLGYDRKLSAHTEMFLNSSKYGVIVVSNNLPSIVKHKLKTFSYIHEGMFENILFTSDASDVIGHPKVNLFIGDGDVYDTALAIVNQVPVLGISSNLWYQRFLISSLEERGLAVQVSVDDLGSDKFDEILEDMLLNKNRWRSNAKVASAIIQPIVRPSLDEALIWIEYMINFKGAPHLIPGQLQWSVNNHLITIIIVLTLVDIGLFLVFYWFIKHFHKLVIYCGKKIYRAMSKKDRTATVSYIKL